MHIRQVRTQLHTQSLSHTRTLVVCVSQYKFGIYKFCNLKRKFQQFQASTHRQSSASLLSPCACPRTPLLTTPLCHYLPSCGALLRLVAHTPRRPVAYKFATQSPAPAAANVAAVVVVVALAGDDSASSECGPHCGLLSVDLRLYFICI